MTEAKRNREIDCLYGALSGEQMKNQGQKREDEEEMN
jgi:hypothetical protein